MSNYLWIIFMCMLSTVVILAGVITYFGDKADDDNSAKHSTIDLQSTLNQAVKMRKRENP